MQRVSSSSSPDLTSTSSSFTCHDSVMCVCVVLVEYGDYLISIAMVKIVFCMQFHHYINLDGWCNKRNVMDETIDYIK